MYVEMIETKSVKMLLKSFHENYSELFIKTTGYPLKLCSSYDVSESHDISPNRKIEKKGSKLLLGLFCCLNFHANFRKKLSSVVGGETSPNDKSKWEETSVTHKSTNSTTSLIFA